MKVHFIYQLQDGPFGGGNQFLKALKKHALMRGVYTENLAEADVVLYNSFEYMPQAAAAKLRYPEKVFIHRVDGPIRLYNIMSDQRDRLVNLTNSLMADGTVFQSNWSRLQNLKFGLQKSPFRQTIVNAPDPVVFNTNGRILFSPLRKIRLICSSWSPNWKKGFLAYQRLDQLLDFTRIEMLFIGNSPVSFRNIEVRGPVGSSELARALKAADIYITASQSDPCSNSLLEALHCGLPCIALRDGGHPEIIGEGGALFEEVEQVPAIIDSMAGAYESYRSKISVLHIDSVGNQYLSFMQQILDRVLFRDCQPKCLSRFGYARIMGAHMLWRLSINHRLRWLFH